MELEELRERVKALSLDEAHSLLFHLLLNIDMLNRANISSVKMKEELSQLNKSVLNHIQSLEKQRELPYEAVHLVGGDSPAGSLRAAFSRKDKIIGIPDHLGIGPIWQLHDEEGRKYRYQWLLNHLLDPEEFLERKYRWRFTKVLQEISSIREDAPIIIWTGENAAEQTTLRYLVYLLRDKNNRLYVINSTREFSERFNTAEMTYELRHSGEVSPERFQAIYENMELIALSSEERQQLETDWLKLAESKEVLRIWQQEEITAVADRYFDEYIIQTAKRLQNEVGTKEFMKSARIIGEVIGHCEEPIGDQYIEYRLRKLIFDGVFDIQGVPKAMRYYSVRLR